MRATFLAVALSAVMLASATTTTTASRWFGGSKEAAPFSGIDRNYQQPINDGAVHPAVEKIMLHLHENGHYKVVKQDKDHQLFRGPDIEYFVSRLQDVRALINGKCQNVFPLFKQDFLAEINFAQALIVDETKLTKTNTPKDQVFVDQYTMKERRRMFKISYDTTVDANKAIRDIFGLIAERSKYESRGKSCIFNYVKDPSAGLLWRMNPWGKPRPVENSAMWGSRLQCDRIETATVLGVSPELRYTCYHEIKAPRMQSIVTALLKTQPKEVIPPFVAAAPQQ